MKPKSTRFWALNKNRLKGLILPMIIIGISFLWGCGSAAPQAFSAPISNTETVVIKLREGMREHSSKINIKFKSEDILDADALTDWGKALVEEALTETDNPREGDYIRYQNGGYKVTCTNEGREYILSVAPKYYLYHFQEEAASNVVSDTLMEIFGEEEWKDLSEYDKAYKIYDYVCTNIKYDKVHEGKSNHTLRSTIYGGLIFRSATCQGYCVTLYRLLKEVGVNCRIITGTVEEGLHAWMLISVDGNWYNADPTWANGDEYRFFLIGSENFTEHIPSDEFNSEDFRGKYKVSKEDY